MTTYTAFAPSPTAPQIFNPVLDGQVYAATVLWNLYEQRWYLQLADLSGNLIFCQPVVGTAAAQPVASLTWAAGIVTAATVNPHNYPIGATLMLTIAGATPAGYNGQFQCLIVGPSTFTFPLSLDPDPATTSISGVQNASVPGTFFYAVNMAAGYFSTSTLIYRAPSGQFEVSP